jgi:uncharacterized protein YbjT (DUF2867 family)
MAPKKVLVVAGATGAQGGGVARAILSDKSSQFALRALTRKPQSEKAAALAKAGAEVVEADLDDVASLERAFAGAYGAYCVTNYWEYFSPEREFTQASNMAKAAKRANLQHVVWSTLEDTRRWVPIEDDRMPTLMGNYKVPHFDAKGEADHVFAELRVPTTNLLTSFYWDNFIYFGLGPKRGPDGKLAITLPIGDKKLPGIGVEDIGKCAYALFRQPGTSMGKTVGIAGEHLTGAEMARALGKALGEEVRYNEVTPEAYRGFGFPGADDLGNMFQFNRDFAADFCAARSVQFSRALNPGLLSFESWLAAYKDRIPLA